jgi:hypothetical protein
MAESERPLLSSGSGSRAKAKPGRLRWILAAAMVAIVGGFGWVAWSAYKSGGTGIDGIVPLIKADNEPTRIRPDDPGGMPVPNQDKAIYDRLDPKRAPPKGVERLLPPPEAPVGRPAAVTPPPDSTPSKPAIPTLGETVPAPERQVGSAVVKAAPEPPPPTLQEQAAASAPQPFTKLEAPPAPPKTAPAAAAPKAPPAQVATTAPAPAAVKPATAISGVRVQLGAVGSEDAAQKEWDRIRKANSDILGSVAPAFVRADLGDKGVVYRIQAGPLATADAAADLCSKLKTRNVGCFVAR